MVDGPVPGLEVAQAPDQVVPSATHPAARLRQLGLRPRKGLSQSFLVEAGIAHAIVEAASLHSAQDDVLEVGPGLGILTAILVRRARHVVAVELDPELAESLRQELGSLNATVHTGDILKVRPESCFRGPYVVVANLPYHITSPALRHLLSAGPPYARRLVVMVQREVADRIAAAPGKLNALAVIIQAQARVRIVRTVPAGAFHPRPRVDSAVLELDPLSDAERTIPRDVVPAFASFVHAGFAQPRKQLANSLAHGLARDKGSVLSLLRVHHLDPSRRPQDLAVPEWVALYRSFVGGSA